MSNQSKNNITSPTNHTKKAAYSPATFSPISIHCFKAYDIRGELGVTLDTDIAYRIGRAFAQFLAAKKVVIGCDIRQSSEEIKQATIKGLLDAGCEVIDLGMTGTEEVYFYTSHYAADGGIEVTASHNPINYNGLKLVREQSKPIGADTGLAEVQALAESGDFTTPAAQGTHQLKADKSAFIEHLLTYIDVSKLTPLKIVVNPGNGSAAPVLDLIEKQLQQSQAPISLIKMHYEPDGSFPHGIPNPMLVENRVATSERVLAEKADLAIAFDGDFDRCFFFDETGGFIEGSYVVGLLAQAFLEKTPAASIVYDPRVIWNTEAIISAAGGKKVLSKSGHSHIKAVMREANAVYGGEMSSHHYFKDFNYCDSGMIPWLLVAELLSSTGKKLSELVNERIAAYPSSGEQNFRLTGITASEVIKQLESYFAQQGTAFTKSTLDGISLNFADWRFNIRASNTEPLIRLNLETKANQALLDTKLAEITAFLVSLGASKV